ncbi:MAG: acyltransferase family protein [Gammaproteobacteria bacterium]|nr:acyltransferase family protein [Gammaproteobacteria bacterium]
MMHRIEHLDSFRAIAIFMVVGIHALSYTNIETSIYGVFEFLLTAIAVPVFFFVDGYLFSFLYKEKKFKYIKYVSKSAKRLLIPWLLFSTLYIIVRYFGEVAGYFNTRIVYENSWYDVLYLLYSSGVSSQMYFLPALFILRLISVVMYRYLKVKLIYMCLISVIGISLFHVFSVEKISSVSLDPFVHAIWGLQFYILGVVTEKSEGIVNNKHKLITLGLMMAGIYILSTNLMIMLQILYLYGVYYLCKWLLYHCEWLNGIGKETMGIYLLHMPFIIYGLVRLSSMFIENTSILLLVVWLSTFFTSLYISRALTKSRIGELLFAIPGSK